MPLGVTVKNLEASAVNSGRVFLKLVGGSSREEPEGRPGGPGRGRRAREDPPLAVF